MPSVSVIVPIYKAESFIEKCIRSLFEQTLVDIEYIFIDDCTPDRSMDILVSVLNEYPLRKKQVKIVKNEKNSGSGATRERGMRMATGEYVIHCDSDDWCEAEMYELMYDTAIKSKADIVCCDFWSEYPQNRICNKCNFQIENRTALLNLRLDIRYSSLWNKLVRRELYEKYNIYPFEGVNMWEDLGIMTRLRYFSKKTVAINKAYYHYNKQNESSIVSIPSLSKIEEQMRCAVLLESFFQDKGDEYSIVYRNLKFVSKSSFILCKPLRDIKRWKSLFADTHSDIWKFTNLPLNMRIIYWLAANNLATLSCLLFDLKASYQFKIK